MAEQEYTKVAIGDIGTQLFWWNPKHSGEGTEGSPYVGKFEYALPVTAGAEFGGDTESFEASETDMDTVAKIMGRRSLNDIPYTINYTKDKYLRAEEISDNINAQTYMEVLSDGSAMVFQGTSSMPSITAGDVRQITLTIVPSFVKFVYDIFKLSKKEADILTGLDLGDGLFTENNAIPVDLNSIPTARQDYHTKKQNA